MLRRLTIVGIVFLFLLVWWFAPAPSGSTPTFETALTATTPSPLPAVELPLSAAAAGIFDVQTGELLWSHAPDEVRPIASVTKLFSAAALLETNDLSGVVEVTHKDVQTEGTSGGLVPAVHYSKRDLLMALLLVSSNDAAAALERTSDTPLLAAMRVLSANVAHTSFADASGLSPNNRSTVRDLALLGSYVATHHPHVLDITTLDRYLGEFTGWENNSPVADMSDYGGGKHGYTPEAGRTLVAIFNDQHANERYGYVILGSTNLRADLLALQAHVASAVQP